MRAKLDRLADRFPDRAGGALFLEGELIMTRSKRDHVPVDLGNLRASGKVFPPVRVRLSKDISVKLAYGDAAAPYALPVHEHPSSHSPPSWEGVPVNFKPSGRGPKYLERPMMDAVPGMAQRMSQRLKL